MKFKCLDNQGNFLGNVNGKNEEDAFKIAAAMNDKVAKVELIPGQIEAKVEDKAPAKKKNKAALKVNPIAEPAAE